jgi:hypothetical protein
MKTIKLNEIDLKNLNDILYSYIDELVKEMRHYKQRNKSGQFNDKIDWYQGHLKYVRNLVNKINK